MTEDDHVHQRHHAGIQLRLPTSRILLITWGRGGGGVTMGAPHVVFRLFLGVAETIVDELFVRYCVLLLF